jgi:uncharacterized membrane protein YjgN (DUF898 family)
MDQFQTPKPLPNATTVLVLGILSIVLCFCYGIIGLILGIIALVLASKDKKLYVGSPGEYTEASFKNLNAGRICAIIGLILSALYIIYVIVIIGLVGFSALSDPQQLMDKINDLK